MARIDRTRVTYKLKEEPRSIFQFIADHQNNELRKQTNFVAQNHGYTTRPKNTKPGITLVKSLGVHGREFITTKVPEYTQVRHFLYIKISLFIFRFSLKSNKQDKNTKHKEGTKTTVDAPMAETGHGANATSFFLFLQIKKNENMNYILPIIRKCGKKLGGATKAYSACLYSDIAIGVLLKSKKVGQRRT